MARRKSESLGRTRLLEAWTPPSNAGAAVGCLATSFTFDSAFFEEECLARFAGLRSGTSEEERELEWIIECEERFSQIRAVVLVDKAHCQGRRSPRWDLLCARGPRDAGILHAKLCLLIWARHMRLIVSSANLTSFGYRRNREVAVVMDAGTDLPLEIEAWREGLKFLGELLPLGGPPDYAGVLRAKEVLGEAQKRLDSLAKQVEPSSSLRFHGIAPGRKPLFDGLGAHWQEARGAVTDIYAVSPFFDPSDKAAKKTIDGLWSLGKQRGDVCLSLSAPVSHDEKSGSLVHAPAAWGEGPRESTEVKIFGVEEVDPEEKERRPLHAKFLALENEEWQLSTAGSANLTAAGTGVGRKVNWEAVVSCLLRRSADKKGCDAVDAAYEAISGEELENPKFQPSQEELEAEEAPKGESLPDGFKSAIYRRAGSTAEIVFSLAEPLPEGWQFAHENKAPFKGSANWAAAGSPGEWVVPWEGAAAPSGFEVSWTGSKGTAWLPVCAASGKDLPPPEILRELSLDMLIAVLTTARPLAETAAALIKKRLAGAAVSVELDPLRRFDASGHLIPKTRRVSGALTALRKRLSEPAPSAEALEWRLEGPFGARALLAAVEKEWAGADERLFFKAEMCLELGGIQPEAVEGCLPPTQQVARIQEFVAGVMKSAAETMIGARPEIADYTKSAFARVKELVP